MISRIAALLLLAPLLGGCLQATIGSVAGGECKIFERPPYAVLGRARYDQDWIDSQVEGGVGGCKWNRPASRPAALDATPGRPVAVPQKKRPGLVKRIRDRIMPAPAPAPIAAPPAVVDPPAPQPKPPEKPRSALDELLHPEGSGRDQLK